jgi:uncharacterized glyoxalase superfamily protein PhnB
VLPSLNLDESLAFAKQMGFELGHRYGDDYAVVARDGMQLHYWACDNKEVAENSGCYVRSVDVRALRAEFAANGVERLCEAEVKPWGMLEFQVTDPSGNVLRFGQIAGS